MRDKTFNRLPNSVKLWLASGERGISSDSIVTFLTGFDAMRCWSSHHPLDAHDFRRCRLLLEQSPEIASMFSRMSRASRIWARLVESWKTLCSTMDAEVPEWRCMNHWRREYGRAERTNQLIHLLTDEKL